MSYLVDSDWVIDYLTGRPEAVQTLTDLRSAGLALSMITFMEIYEGIYGSRDPDAAERVFLGFLQGVTLIPVDQTIALGAARLRSHLRRQRRAVTHRYLDLLIAATAITRDLVLLTNNSKDYEDIPELRLYQRS